MPLTRCVASALDGETVFVFPVGTPLVRRGESVLVAGEFRVRSVGHDDGRTVVMLDALRVFHRTDGWQALAPVRQSA
jgi:hypothetical protein